MKHARELIAIVLAAALLFPAAGCRKETPTVPQSDVTEPAPAEEGKPETTAPETDAPETEKPETEAPETVPPETEAPETTTESETEAEAPAEPEEPVVPTFIAPVSGIISK